MSTKVRLIDGKLPHSTTSEAIERWERWRGKWVIVGTPHAPENPDWKRVGCNTDLVWPLLGPPEILAERPDLSHPCLCRHQIQAGD